MSSVSFAQFLMMLVVSDDISSLNLIGISLELYKYSRLSRDIEIYSAVPTVLYVPVFAQLFVYIFRCECAYSKRKKKTFNQKKQKGSTIRITYVPTRTQILALILL